MAVAPVNSATSTLSPTPAPAQSTAASAFGLGFDSLLKIILTQLTYQDPLKPMDNFQFVSQLAQFSQIQLGQTTNDNLQTLMSAQGALQATGLLGRQVDANGGSGLLSGRVVAVSLSDGAPKITIETEDKQTVAGLSLSSVFQIREVQ